MRSNFIFMQQFVWTSIRGMIVIIVLMMFVPVSLAATPSQLGDSWDYRLLGPLNSSQNPVDKLVIVLTGSGSFNRSPDKEYISGGGNYTIIGTDGSIVGSGTWTAKEFVSFELHAPGKSPGEGGRLELKAYFDGTGDGSLKGLVDVLIQCSMWGDVTVGTGYPWPPDFVEVGPYTNPLTGAVMFNLNQYQ